MAQFQASIKGSKGEATRLGHKTSGITAKVNGWRLGVAIDAVYNADTDCDVFNVFITGGSNRCTSTDYIIREHRDAEGRLTGFTVSEKPAEEQGGA